MNRGDNSACPFCAAILEGKTVSENPSAVSITDNYPVTPGHLLVIPRRHFTDIFDITAPERDAVWALLEDAKKRINSEDPSVTGFNIGVNAGASAGQTIAHCHIHLIPRRDGDTPEPRGGVRGVIPGRRSYGAGG